MAASVWTRVVSWNEAAEMNESVDSEALVMPSSSGRSLGAFLPEFLMRSFSAMNRNLSTTDPARQAACDVLGLGRLARDLGQDVPRRHLRPVLHHEVGAG